MPQRLVWLGVALVWITACSTASDVSVKPSGSSETVAPSTTNDVLRESLYGVLEQCQAVKTLDEIARMPKRRRALYRQLRDHLVAQYQYPKAPLIYQYDSGRDFTEPSISRIGSYIVRKDAKLAPGTFPPSGSPDVRWQPSAQVFLKDPSSSYYTLFIDCGYLVKQGLSADARLTAYVDAAARAALNDSYSSHRSISVGVGLFRNELADVFDRVSRGRPYASDFLPLLDVYDLYGSNNRPIDDDSKIIGSFFGVVIRENAQQRATAGIRFEDAVKLSAGLAFLKVSGEQSTIWTREETGGSDAGYFRILVAPNGFQLEPVPSKAQIEAVWQQQPTLPLKIDGNAARVVVSEFEPGVVQIPFGPAPADAALTVSASLSSSTDDLLSKAERDRIPTEAQGLFTLIPVRITGRPETFSTGTLEYRDSDAVIKLAMHNGLTREYSVPVRIAMKPQAISEHARYNFTREGGRYQWKIQYRVKPSGAYSTANVTPISVACSDERLTAFAKGLELQPQSLTSDQFTLPVLWSGPALESAAPEACRAQIRVEIKDQSGTHPRTLRADLTLPRRVDVTDTVRVGAAERDLTELLKDDVIIAPGITAAVLRLDKNYTALERNALVLQKLPISYDSASREYVIPAKFVNLANLQPKSKE